MLVKQRQWGKTDLHSSIVGIGTVKFGRNVGVKNKSPDGFKLPDDKTLEQILNLCLEYGVNHFDTAPAYGHAEERVGKLLIGKRQDFIISTKVGEVFDGTESRYDFSPKAIIKSIDNSLAKLKTDYLDCVLLHCPREDLKSMEEFSPFETLNNLKEAGKLRYFGASTHTVEGGHYAVNNSDVVMLPFNPDYQEHLEVINLAKEKQSGVLIKKGLFSGHLDVDNPTKSIEKCYEAAFLNSSVSSLVIGSINPKHVEQNFEIAADYE